MKTNLIIGMGIYGHYLCQTLVDSGSQVMVVDMNEENLKDVLDVVVSAQIGDCTKPEVIRSLGVGNFDNVFVCMSENFQNSLEITDLVKEMGARHVISIADREIQAKFLSKNGADEVIYPDRDSAQKIGIRCATDYVKDYINISSDHCITEISIPQKWAGKTLRSLDTRARFGINVLGVNRDGVWNYLLSPDFVFETGDTIYVLAESRGLINMVERLEKEDV